MAGFFESLTHRTDTEPYEPGEVIFRAGEPGDLIFAVLEGEVTLEHDGRSTRVGPGELFGEDVVCGEPLRAATARATTAVRVAPIGRALYRHLAARDGSLDSAVRSTRRRRTLRALALAALSTLVGAFAATAQVWTPRNHVLTIEDGDVPSQRFGEALAVGDFNGDGRTDLAVGERFHSPPTATNAGRVAIFHGTAAGLAGPAHLVTGAKPDLAFGLALVAVDVDGDGQDELAVGAPGYSIEGVAGKQRVGAVFLLEWYPPANAYVATDLIHQDSPGIQGIAEENDRFGTALAAGDFDADGFQDLAVGTPQEAVGEIANAGAVQVLFGSAAGLTDVGDQLLVRATPEPEGFGTALAVGDFDGDGVDDLAIGAPHTLVSGTVLHDGSVWILPGSQGTGIVTAAAQVFSRSSLGVRPPGGKFSRFGAALTAGDFDRGADCLAPAGCIDDLAIGAPQAEDPLDLLSRSGLVFLVYGDPVAGALDLNDPTTLSQALFAPALGSPPEDGDAFGSALAAGRLSDGVRSELAIGTAEEEFASFPGAGVVHLALDLRQPYDPTSNPEAQFLYARPGLATAPIRASQRFGGSVAIGDFDGDGWGDLAIGVFGYAPGTGDGIGGVQILYGALFADGFESGDSSLWTSSAP